MSMDYYREYILDHYRNPRNHGTLEQPDVHSEDTNPLCGDQLAMDLLLEGDHVKEVRFQGRGCAISQASASMLSEMIEGRTIEEVIQLGKDDVLDAWVSASARRVPNAPFSRCAFSIVAWLSPAWRHPTSRRVKRNYERFFASSRPGRDRRG